MENQSLNGANAKASALAGVVQFKTRVHEKIFAAPDLLPSNPVYLLCFAQRENTSRDNPANTTKDDHLSVAAPSFWQ
jgi:hypothetical protein